MATKTFKHTMEQLIERHPYWSPTTIRLAELMRDDEYHSDDTVDVVLSIFGGRSFVWNSYRNVEVAALEARVSLHIEREFRTGWRKLRLEVAVSGRIGDVLSLSSALDKGMADLEAGLST